MTLEEIAQIEVIAVEHLAETQPTIEERLTDIEQATEDVIIALNERGIV